MGRRQELKQATALALQAGADDHSKLYGLSGFWRAKEGSDRRPGSEVTPNDADWAWLAARFLKMSDADQGALLMRTFNAARHYKLLHAILAIDPQWPHNGDGSNAYDPNGLSDWYAQHNSGAMFDFSTLT